MHPQARAIQVFFASELVKKTTYWKGMHACMNETEQEEQVYVR